MTPKFGSYYKYKIKILVFFCFLYFLSIYFSKNSYFSKIQLSEYVHAVSFWARGLFFGTLVKPNWMNNSWKIHDDRSTTDRAKNRQSLADENVPLVLAGLRDVLLAQLHISSELWIRIRIRIGSGFNGVPGSGSGFAIRIRIRIQQLKNWPQI